MKSEPSMQTSTSATEPSTITSSARPSRRSCKRRFKNLPKPAIAVRGLLDAASEEEKKTAQETCALILELWLGKTSKAEIGRRLNLPPLRVWQLSQQALSGMIAGLLVQPRMRSRLKAGAGVASVVRRDPATNTTQLQREILRLKQDLAASQQVNALLKQFPALTQTPSKERRGEAHATPTHEQRGPRVGRKPAASRRDQAGTARAARAEPRRDDAHAAHVAPPRPA